MTEAKPVKRYSLYDVDTTEDEDGPWMLFSDHQAALAEARREAPGVPEGLFSLRHLQKHLPWTIPYSREFEASAGDNPKRRVAHDVLHVMKSLGRIAAECEYADHGRDGKLSPSQLSKEVADLVICALHIARLEGFDLHESVISNSEARNAATIPPERPAAPSPTPNLQQAVDAAYEGFIERIEEIAADWKADGDWLKVYACEYIVRDLRALKGQPTPNSVTAGVEKSVTVRQLIEELRAEAIELRRRGVGPFDTPLDANYFDMLADQLGDTWERAEYALLQSSGERK